jgi:hypothetical protein
MKTILSFVVVSEHISLSKLQLLYRLIVVVVIALADALVEVAEKSCSEVLQSIRLRDDLSLVCTEFLEEEKEH